MSKIISSNFTAEQAEAWLAAIIKMPAAELFDMFIKGEATEGEVRSWLVAIDRARGIKKETPAPEEKLPASDKQSYEQKAAAALEQAKKDCAKGKHWFGVDADLKPHSHCAWSFCGAENNK